MENYQNNNSSLLLKHLNVFNNNATNAIAEIHFSPFLPLYLL